MLDSSSSKISSVKPAVITTSGNVDTNVSSSPSPSTSGAVATVNNSVVHSAKTEAEVRFIVRVVAEEHIVIDGKVKQVKHLDEVTMLRGVSRIAWPGEKDQDEFARRAESILDTVKHPSSSHASKESDPCCEPSNAISMPQAPLDTPADDIEVLESNKSGPANILQSEHLTTHTDTISSPDQVVPNNNEEGTTIDATKSNELACDNETSTFISNIICETQDHQLGSSYAIEQVCQQSQPSVTESTEDQSYEDEDLNQESLAERDEAECFSIDNQMIVDTLNDCVLKVDRESRQIEQLVISSINGDTKKENCLMIKVEPSERFEKAETIKIEEVSCIQHNEITKNTARNQIVEINSKPLSETLNFPPNNESTRETIPQDSDINSIRENDAQANEAAKKEFTEKRASNKKPDNSCSSTRRRKPSDNGFVSKRVRQGNSNDLPKPCRGSRRMAENSIGRADKAILSSADAEENPCYFSNQSRILAKWSDNHFYPGTISKQKGDRKFEVTFYDGARKDIADTDLIPVPNILGKQVRITIAEGYCVNAVVLDQLSANGQLMFDVEYNQNGLVKKRVPLDDVFLTAEQGIPLINQPIKPDKNPDESMFAGVDLDNIVPFKRSRRLQEMEEFEPDVVDLGELRLKRGSRRGLITSDS